MVKLRSLKIVLRLWGEEKHLGRRKRTSNKLKPPVVRMFYVLVNYRKAKMIS